MVLLGAMVQTSPIARSCSPVQETDLVTPASNSTDFDSLTSLFEQLDSPVFKDRETATEELIKRGPEILKPLTVHFFNSSSEAGWRIHRILEGIGKNGEESDFLKSIAIIQLLYGAQDPESQGRLGKLQYQWKATRRTEAARKLNKLGFKFVAQGGMQLNDAVLERARIEMMVRAAAVRELGGIEIATAPDPMDDSPVEKPATKPWVNPRLNRQKSILQAEDIISKTADENREIVESLLPPTFQVTLPPGALRFPEGWNADEESLKLIDDLSTLASLTFQKQAIDEKLQAFISRQNMLTSLEFIDCQFDKDSDKLSLPTSINSLRFEGSLPPPASFASVGTVSTLKLSKMKLDAEIAYAISKRRIQIIDLEEVEFTRDSINSIVNMKGLFRVSLSLCKFNLEWLEEIRSKNPNIIAASPKAFLGVQGPIDINGRGLKGCQISEVVPNTAAAKSGMQPLDIVTAMDGTKISRFEDLRLLISQKRPGESMKLKVRRGDKTLDLKVELGKMGQNLR